MLTIAVLGALLITGEYDTGLIRSTFAAVPTRIPVLAAKALTLVVLTAAVTLVSATLSYFLTMPRLSQYDLVPALDDPGTWRVFGGTLYSLISAALFSLGIGTLLRSTAASLTAALTVLPLLPSILSFIRLDWVETIVSYLPLPASSALLTTGAVETQGAYPLRTSEPDRDGRLRCRPYRGGRRHAAPTRRLTPCIRYPKELSTMTAEILAATEHLVLRRMTNDAAAALAAYRSDRCRPATSHGRRNNGLGRLGDSLSSPQNLLSRKPSYTHLISAPERPYARSPRIA